MSERGFLGRWSGRKRAAREEERRDTEQPADAAAGAPDGRPGAEDAGGPDRDETGAVAPAGDENGEEPISEEELARLPPVAEAERSADLRPYLRRGVPPELRRAALRRMWSLNPAIRDYVDPALDYAWDFNAPATGQATAAAGVARLLGTAVRDAAVDQVRAGAAGPPEGVGRQTRDARGSVAVPPPERSPEDVRTASAPAPAETAPAASGSGRRRRHGGAIPRTPDGGGPDGGSDGG
jgi:hypothetical protein